VKLPALPTPIDDALQMERYEPWVRAYMLPMLLVRADEVIE
jgi:hypothetical protein